MLDFSKVEAGKLAFERIDFDLLQTIEGTSEMLAERAQSKGIELASAVASDVPVRLRGDPGRLRQILVNLIGNAIKFTETGEVVVGISKERETESKIVLRFVVQDTGIGIPPDTQSRLFQFFSQGDASTSRRYGGTGLGLAISKQLVELMNGQIGVESKPGCGSTFWFTAEFEKTVDENSAGNAAEPACLKPNGRGEFQLPTALYSELVKERILLAEDNIVNQKVALGNLRKFGLTADAVANGVEVLEALKRVPYGIIFMDCQMPKMDGLEATRLIRELESNAEQPCPWNSPVHIIALTASAMHGDREKCFAAGMNDYVAKPIGLGEMQAALERWRPSGLALAVR